MSGSKPCPAECACGKHNKTRTSRDKRCAKCGETKPLEEFHQDPSSSDGRTSRCRNCRCEATRRRRATNPEKARERVRRWRQSNPEQDQEGNRLRRSRIRAAVFAHYGQVCACPGCGAVESLTIDHINGGGGQHRQELGGVDSTRMYRWLIKNGFPGGFQVLCRPCNTSKHDGEHCRLDHAKTAGAAA